MAGQRHGAARITKLGRSLRFPPCAARYAIETAGYLYTKQGSTLGGHVISKHLERQLALIPHLDQWFFAGYHDNGAQWKQFIAMLETSDLDETEVVAAAQQSFENICYFCDAMTLLMPLPIETAHEA